jgi:hypothetical protein
LLNKGEYNGIHQEETPQKNVETQIRQAHEGDAPQNKVKRRDPPGENREDFSCLRRLTSRGLFWYTKQLDKMRVGG